MLARFVRPDFHCSQATKAWLRRGTRTRIVWRLFLCSALCAFANAAFAAYPFYTGADISLETFMQQEGVKFTDNSSGTPVQLPMDQIMYDAGANLFRLRIFVNPATTYTNSNAGAIQTTSYDIALAQQIKTDDPDAKLLLDFHYSDTWADPGHQAKPSAWSSDASLSTLESDVTIYTESTLNSFYSSGVMPNIVQIGNETTDGMLWQTGSSGAAAVGGRILYQGVTYTGLGLTNNKPTQAQTNQSWQNFGGLLNAAIKGVRNAQSDDNLPRIPVSLSIDKGDLDGQPQSFYANIQSSSLGNVTDFDIEGVDFYPSSTDLISTMQTNLTTLAGTNETAFTKTGNTLPLKRIMVLETNYPWENGGSSSYAGWDKTPAGQEAEFQAVRSLVQGLPYNDGEGALYWYPEAVQAGGFNIYNGGATALFDATSSHNALAAMNAFAPVRGDFNGDGAFTAADIPAMLSALANLSDYQSNNGITDPDMLDIGDFNGDGQVTSADLQGMLAALRAGQGSSSPAPEPPAGWLLAISGLAMLHALRHQRKM
ncbi:MAG TPA: glycosyl hydrolase 53 family protein [Pirellulales bacterium]|nr:glycosyl hydrolase 53 family protein [Pirellulales bacterium]